MVTTSSFGLLAVLSAALLVLLVREQRRRRSIDGRLAETLAALQANASAMRALQNEVLTNHSREQRRIANELHNGVGQNLAGIALLLKGLEGRLRAESSAHAAGILRIAELIHKTSIKSQDMILVRESDLAAAGGDLSNALLELAAHTRQLFQTPCRFQGLQDCQLEAVTVHQLLAILREAVANAVRHAQADHITLQLEKDGEHLLVAVEDDGCGPTPQAEQRQARGKRVMATRAEKIGGRLSILPRTPCGTRVECRLPYPATSQES